MRRLLFAAAALTIGAPVSGAEPVTGRWLTAEKSGIIEIAPCGAQLCGTIVKLTGQQRGGADPRDANNPNPTMRSRRIVGLPILTGFTARRGDWRGQIYDPNSGKTYRSIVRIAARDTLEVKGCIGPFCRTQVWTRAR